MKIIRAEHKPRGCDTLFSNIKFDDATYKSGWTKERRDLALQLRKANGLPYRYSDEESKAVRLAELLTKAGHPCHIVQSWGFYA